MEMDLEGRLQQLLLRMRTISKRSTGMVIEGEDMLYAYYIIIHRSGQEDLQDCSPIPILPKSCKAKSGGGYHEQQTTQNDQPGEMA
jgi:hypothetical protein